MFVRHVLPHTCPISWSLSTQQYTAESTGGVVWCSVVWASDLYQGVGLWLIRNSSTGQQHLQCMLWPTDSQVTDKRLIFTTFHHQLRILTKAKKARNCPRRGKTTLRAASVAFTTHQYRCSTVHINGAPCYHCSHDHQAPSNSNANDINSQGERFLRCVSYKTRVSFQHSVAAVLG